MATGNDERYVFGAMEPLPAAGFPAGRLRWRIRNKDWVRARVRTAAGIREFYVKEEAGKWVAGVETGRNETTEQDGDGK